jgi:hypothetical protein
MINVGDIAKDSVTGFKGMVIARTEWLNGCARILIQPQELTKEGKTMEAEQFDEQQVVLVKAKGFKPVRETGGPRPDHLIKRR